VKSFARLSLGPANPDPLNNQLLEPYNLNIDFSGGAHDRAAPEHHRRARGVRLYAADDWPAAGRLAAAEHLLRDLRRHRGAAGRRRGYDPDLGGSFRGYGFYLLKGKPVFL
jgi:hypothetical protein